MSDLVSIDQIVYENVAHHMANIRKISALSYAYNLENVVNVPDWMTGLEPNRIRILANIINDNDTTGYFDLFGNGDNCLLYRLLSDNTIDDDEIEDIIACFDGGFNIYDEVMFNVPIGPDHVKEFRRIIENRVNGLLTLEDASNLIAMFKDVTDFEETVVLNEIKKRRIEMLNAKRMYVDHFEEEENPLSDDIKEEEIENE